MVILKTQDGNRELWTSGQDMGINESDPQKLFIRDERVKEDMIM